MAVSVSASVSASDSDSVSASASVSGLRTDWGAPRGHRLRGGRGTCCSAASLASFLLAGERDRALDQERHSLQMPRSRSPAPRSAWVLAPL